MGKLSRETPPPCEGEPMGAARTPFHVTLQNTPVTLAHVLTLMNRFWGILPDTTEISKFNFVLNDVGFYLKSQGYVKART